MKPETTTKPETNTVPARPGEARWPHCSSLGGLCPTYEMSQALGANIQDLLMTFIWAGEAGARLTLQKNRDGFTAQITGAVQKAAEEPLDLPRLQALRQRLAPVQEAASMK